jgi:hypothetical protein
VRRARRRSALGGLLPHGGTGLCELLAISRSNRTVICGAGGALIKSPIFALYGETRDEVLNLIKEAIELHIEDLQDEGAEIPKPHVSSEFVEVHAA